MQEGHTWAIPRYRHNIQRANFGTKTLSYILPLRNFCFKFVQVFITWYLTISRKETLISFSKAVNIFVLNSVTDITQLEAADTVVVGSMISNIVGPGFSHHLLVLYTYLQKFWLMGLNTLNE